MADDTKPGILRRGPVALRPVQLEDAALYTRWMHEAQVLNNYLEESVDMTLEQARAFLAKRVGQPSFVITLQRSGRAVGYCELAARDADTASAALGMFIGEGDCRGKGLGRAALTALLDYGFGPLGLNSVWLSTWQGNSAALALYRSMGFEQVGMRRAAWRHAGKLYGLVYMDLLACEWAQHNKEAAP